MARGEVAADGPMLSCVGGLEVSGMKFVQFRSATKPWSVLFSEAAAFAGQVGPQRLVSVSHSSDRNTGVVTVWFRPEVEETTGLPLQLDFKAFDSSFSSWDGLFAEAADFAEACEGHVLNISHSADAARGVVVVWFSR